ncbi:hypothetical protein B1813_16300 [Saccharomonospora piscinae]|uniref:Uncharacterized protein n=1 Tax=Saccharomonospora piscinae TaxID=687388 RepID=A0A1V9A1X1_SACPI|nr:hypothetical protein [Saccharomonospora piscinae]OQO91053.1 hypothetical protein B1813_16300 [Saccharomonospora piscinae]
MSNDPLGSIELEEETSYGRTVVEALPFGGGDAVKIFESGASALSDGDLSLSEVQGLATEGTGFVNSCMGTASSLATDPIGTLVGEGLDFLISVCQPLQDLIHMVSGDGPALANAAGNFSAIGEGIVQFGDKFGQDAMAALAGWEGDAAEAAAAKLGEFAKGIRAVAGEAGNISQLLQISSMIMTVIEEFIKALLTELITWLVMIWVPALAAAIPTAGASTAAAGTATGVRVAQTGSRATQQVGKLRRLLDKVHDLLSRLKQWMSRQGNSFREAMDAKRMQAGLARMEVDAAAEAGTRASATARLYNADGGMVGERVTQGFGRSMRGTLSDTAAGQVSADSVAGYVEDAGTAQDAGDIGDDQSAATTSRQLDF